jgi:hypothetical protein
LYYYYRFQRPVAYLFWSGSVLTPLMLLAATLFMT